MGFVNRLTNWGEPACTLCLLRGFSFATPRGLPLDCPEEIFSSGAFFALGPAGFCKSQASPGPFEVFVFLKCVLLEHLV